MPPEANQAAIQTVGLTKVFRDFWHRPRVRALNDLNFEVRPGEVFGLLGPNGSGKSTTIKLLLGLLFPTKGAIRILGRQPRDVRVKDRLGFLPEETYLYPYLNAHETLDFFGRLGKLSSAERRRRVDALIEMVGLSGARKRPLHEYSKGMARRIGLAQALINDPELVLLDEPTTGLDPLGTREVKNLILELKNRGKTILLCSHLLADVQDVCDRIGVLYAGRLWVVGHVDELLAKEQLTQITISDLTADQQQRISEFVHDATGGADIEVGHPKERLEDYFLRIVREAREAQPETTGAGVGHFDASLFAEEPKPATPDQVIERLTTIDTPKPSTPAPVAEPSPEPQPEQHVLDRLSATQPKPTPEPEQPAEQPQQPPEPDAEQESRRSVLDRLVKPQTPDKDDPTKS